MGKIKMRNLKKKIFVSQSRACTFSVEMPFSRNRSAFIKKLLLKCTRFSVSFSIGFAMGKIKMRNLKKKDFRQSIQSMHIFSGNALFKEQKCIYKKMIAEVYSFFSWCYITSVTNWSTNWKMTLCGHFLLVKSSFHWKFKNVSAFFNNLCFSLISEGLYHCSQLCFTKLAFQLASIKLIWLHLEHCFVFLQFTVQNLLTKVWLPF